jgi:hypothetical protein
MSANMNDLFIYYRNLVLDMMMFDYYTHY